MNFVPAFSETLVLAYSAKEAKEQLKINVKPSPDDAFIPKLHEQDYLFTGWVRNGKFRIIRNLGRPENFMPSLKGRIESTSNGSIIFLNYRLNFSSVLFLSLWSLITVSMALIFVMVYEHILYATISILAGIINYTFTTFSFQRQVKKTRKVFHSIFDDNSFPE